VQATGAGLLVPQDAASDAIARTIADLLSDPTYRIAAQHLEQEIKQLGLGTANAVRGIEALKE
jgi:UDP:flavonoid glycosyltransferase YjiC (YdhE family)